MSIDPNATIIGDKNLSSAGLPAKYIPYFLIFGIIAVWKTPQVFINPRFWAEEGAMFYPYCRSHPMLECLSYLHTGYYQLLTDAFTFFASKAPLLYGPTVTTFCAIVLHMTIVYQLILFARGYEVSRLSTVLLVAAWALLPQTFEVWMSATNAQWVIGVSMLLILATPTFLLEDRRKIVLAWTAVCGLSGIPGVLLAPLFFIRAAWEKSRLLWLVTTLLGLCAIVQLIVLKIHFREVPAYFQTHGLERHYADTPLLLISPTLLQTIIAPLLSTKVATPIGIALRDPDRAQFVFFILSVVGFGVFILILAMAWSGKHRFVASLIATAWLFVSFVQTFGALGNSLDLLSGWFGGRYFLFGAMCLCLLLALGTKAASHVVAVTTTAMLGLIILVGAVQAQLAVWPRVYRSGPSWRDQVNACPANSVCHVVIWPTGWSVDITK